MTVRLADQIEVLDFAASVHRDRERHFLRHLLRFELGGFEVDGDRVHPRLEQRPDFGPVAAEGVFGSDRLAPVDPDGGEGVDHLAVEIDILLGQKLFGGLELAGELPLVAAELLNLLFIPPEIGVGNHSGGEKRAVIVARKLCRNRLVLPLRAAEPPLSAKVDHRTHILLLSNYCWHVIAYNIWEKSGLVKTSQARLRETKCNFVQKM